MICDGLRARFSAAAISIGLFALTAPAQAQSVDQRQATTRQLSDVASLEVYGGYLTGQSRELVFDVATGRKVSELFWNVNRAAVVGGVFAFKPFDWFTFKVAGWTPVYSSNRMEDYDWLTAPFTDWSDRSEHGDTPLNYTYQIDLSGAVRIASFGGGSLFDTASLSVLGGYRWFTIGWTANGGSFLYSAGGFRNNPGNFADGQTVISYRQ